MEQHKACKKYISKSLGTMVTLTIIKNIFIYILRFAIEVRQVFVEGEWDKELVKEKKI